MISPSRRRIWHCLGRDCPARRVAGQAPAGAAAAITASGRPGQAVSSATLVARVPSPSPSRPGPAEAARSPPRPGGGGPKPVPRPPAPGDSKARLNLEFLHISHIGLLVSAYWLFPLHIYCMFLSY